MIFLLRIFLIQYYFNNIGWNYINKVDSIILIISVENYVSKTDSIIKIIWEKIK